LTNANQLPSVAIGSKQMGAAGRGGWSSGAGGY
jgi:hypothetical protein